MRDADAMIAALSEQPGATALLVDFDGSLSPIVLDPAAARAVPEAIAVLRRLAGALGRIGIVSGRPVEFLAEQVPVPGVVFAGLYGTEYLINGEHTVDPRVEAYVPAVAAAAAEAERRLPGVLVERKAGLAVTLHWRATPERADEVLTVGHDLAARHGLDAPMRGRMALELRPPIAIDKGDAVRTLVAGYSVGAFAGDDRGDLPAFDALTRAVAAGSLARAARIGVRSSEAPSELLGAADLVVDGPAGLVALLARVADEIS